MRKTTHKMDTLFRNVFLMEDVEVEGGDFWDIEDILGEEFSKVFGKGTVDDLSLTAFASNSYEDPRIHGRFRFCVYGGLKYEELKKRLESMQSDILTVEDIYHPEQTYGISFNGVYENEDTTYVGGKYVLRRA